MGEGNKMNKHTLNLLSYTLNVKVVAATREFDKHIARLKLVTGSNDAAHKEFKRLQQLFCESCHTVSYFVDDFVKRSMKYPDEVFCDD